MKTVLITGASSGIGYATALAFARKGYQVIATMRSLNKNSDLQEAARKENLGIDFLAIDVTDEESVIAGVKAILKKHQYIDVLINNAGAGYLGTLEQTSLAEAQNIMDVNFFGVWRLTQAVVPGMRARKSGRILSITSIGGVIGQPFNEAYCAAKFAVEGMMESFAPIARRFGIHVSLIEPGPVNSEFVSSTLQNSATLTSELENDYRLMFDSYTEATKNAFAQLAQKPDDIARILVDIVMAEKPNFRYQTSELSHKIASLKLVDSSGNKSIEISGSRL